MCECVGCAGKVRIAKGHPCLRHSWGNSIGLYRLRSRDQSWSRRVLRKTFRSLRIVNASYGASNVTGNIVRSRVALGSIDKQRKVTVSRVVRSDCDLHTGLSSVRMPKQRQPRVVARKENKKEIPGPPTSVRDLKQELRYWKERRDITRENVKAYARIKKRITIMHRQAEMYEKYGGSIPQAQMSSDSEPEEEREKISQEILDIATTECWEPGNDVAMVNQLDIPDPEVASKIIADVKMVTSVKRQADGSGERPFTVLLEFTRGNLRAYPVVRPVDEILKIIGNKGAEKEKSDTMTQTERGEVVSQERLPEKRKLIIGPSEKQVAVKLIKLSEDDKNKLVLSKQKTNKWSHLAELPERDAIERKRAVREFRKKLWFSSSDEEKEDLAEEVSTVGNEDSVIRHLNASEENTGNSLLNMEEINDPSREGIIGMNNRTKRYNKDKRVRTITGDPKKSAEDIENVDPNLGAGVGDKAEMSTTCEKIGDDPIPSTSRG